MNEIRFSISKSCCLMYNYGTSNKINYGTNNKINFGTINRIDLIPCRLSNLLHQRISPHVATKPMLKHRVYSSSANKDATGLRFEAPEVSGNVVLYGLFGLVAQSILIRGGIERVLKSNACYYIVLGVSAVLVARGFLGNIMRGFALLHNKPFSIGDMIKVGHLEGQVIEMGLITTSLLTEENRRALLPTSWLSGQDFVNITGSPSHAMVLKIDLSIDEIEKIPEISEEIRNMMRSNSIIYLEQEQPYCYLSEVDPLGLTLTIGCKLKEGCKDELSSAKYDIFRQSIQIMKKHGAYLDMN